MLSKEQLGIYLKSIRNSLHISLREVNTRTGISFTHLNMIENGKRNVSPALLRNLADLYNVDYLDLYEKAGYIDLIDDEKKNKIDNNIQGMPEKVTSSATVFVYGVIPAGTPIECIEDILDTEEIPVEMLKGGKQYFGLRIKGNSMEPEYLNNDTIILEKVDDCESGDDCVVMVNGDDGTFKRVFKNDNGIILQPLNNSYSPFIFTNEQINKLPVKIIGRVVELRRKKK